MRFKARCERARCKCVYCDVGADGVLRGNLADHHATLPAKAKGQERRAAVDTGSGDGVDAVTSHGICVFLNKDYIYCIE
jgi:hypothetical protein